MAENAEGRQLKLTALVAWWSGRVTSVEIGDIGARDRTSLGDAAVAR
jgi:hypothetical protein